MIWDFMSKWKSLLGVTGSIWRYYQALVASVIIARYSAESVALQCFIQFRVNSSRRLFTDVPVCWCWEAKRSELAFLLACLNLTQLWWNVFPSLLSVFIPNYYQTGVAAKRLSVIEAPQPSPPRHPAASTLPPLTSQKREGKKATSDLLVDFVDGARSNYCGRMEPIRQWRVRWETNNWYTSDAMGIKEEKHSPATCQHICPPLFTVRGVLKTSANIFEPFICHTLSKHSGNSSGINRLKHEVCDIIFLLKNSLQLLTIEIFQGQESSLEGHLVAVMSLEPGSKPAHWCVPCSTSRKSDSGVKCLARGQLTKNEIQTLWLNSQFICHSVSLEKVSKLESKRVKEIILWFSSRKCVGFFLLNDFHCY